MVLLQPDPQSTEVEVGVVVDRKVRWKARVTLNATGSRDVWVRGYLYAYMCAYLRQYHTVLKSDDSYSIQLDQLWNFLEV